jgi:peptide-methionine (S)-S-oxide reductase
MTVSPLRSLFPALLLAALRASPAASGAFAATVAGKSSTAPRVAARDTALFAGGCFWCLETAYEGQPGVITAVSGYSGGTTRNPKYQEVGRGGTGHAEALEVTFDPSRTSYAKLLDLFWHNIDPTQANGQFCDRGPQYRSAIFWRTEAQRVAALASRAKIDKSGILHGKPIVTEIVRAGAFYPAEEYHQDFWKKDPDQYFSYRKACGRDARLRALWGDQAGHSMAYEGHE